MPFTMLLRCSSPKPRETGQDALATNTLRGKGVDKTHVVLYDYEIYYEWTRWTGHKCDLIPKGLRQVMIDHGNQKGCWLRLRKEHCTCMMSN